MIVRIFPNSLHDHVLTITQLLQGEIDIEHVVFEATQQAESLADYSAFLGMHNYYAPNTEIWLTLAKNMSWSDLNIETLLIVDVEKKEPLYLIGKDLICASFVYFIQSEEVKYNDPALWHRFIRLVLLVEQECNKLESKNQGE